jgi:cell wall assembly regulator SMI1
VSKRKRVIGTTDEAIERTEAILGRTLPPSLRQWYLAHNGSGALSPVRDERDPRTWNDLLELREQFVQSAEDLGIVPGDVEQLVPIIDPGGDTVCLDYTSRHGEEPRVVLVSHEDGTIQELAPSFGEFIAAYEMGKLERLNAD